MFFGTLFKAKGVINNEQRARLYEQAALTHLFCSLFGLLTDFDSPPNRIVCEDVASAGIVCKKRWKEEKKQTRQKKQVNGQSGRQVGRGFHRDYLRRLAAGYTAKTNVQKRRQQQQ